ncbi:uncharacterized protein CTHT_0054260 [Thermochaetoides thermophila DSM 1495]|uniref:Uncharacterized protein n=1 Tax=Chaetomium thermophilum (strain DSM 1495 / CBS 144.50 / IMI 039719) TaxID=759272 RepID=G0SBP0_CHATD|nr:hypothetical protein CTHT_0054260 [Thermochaetoides thermophila DSM 1495]EGS18816.1 hypothetical protein CTHT_0054260 [Thermochaetoides thermophila DSM 1495]
MAWWDSKHRAAGPSPSLPPPIRPRDSRQRLVMGDVFPRLDQGTLYKIDTEQERERAMLPPVLEVQRPGLPTTPALVVHVEIRFTDPVIRSRYSRTYASSPGFAATNRICRGLIRRIERCSQELLTRKDSSALDMFKAGSGERKPQRFEMNFRIMRRDRDKGDKTECAERTYRSYQKQPLTVALAKEVVTATHRMVGLFMRRHDDKFRWVDCPFPDSDPQAESLEVTGGGPPTLLCVPNSRFNEATQKFEFTPGYSIDLFFRSRSHHRPALPTYDKRLRISSTQTTPLTLQMTDDLLWRVLEAINQGLELKKREHDEHLRNRVGFGHSRDDALEIAVRIKNNLGPIFTHAQRQVKSKLGLFRDPRAADCEDFLRSMEHYLSHARNQTDKKINALNDLDFRVVELKGVNWNIREPLKFTIGPSASYGRRTIGAALERIQTGIGDVIRGHNVAIHIQAHKRGHLILDKAIVAHEKRGRPKEYFATPDEAMNAFVSRLKHRIQQDIDMVFEDTCAIDDLPENDEDHIMQPVTSLGADRGLFGEAAFSSIFMPPSPSSSPTRKSRTTTGAGSLRSEQTSFSRPSLESVQSFDYLWQQNEDLFTGSNSRPSSGHSIEAPSASTSNGRPDWRSYWNAYQRPRGNDRFSLLSQGDSIPAKRSFSLAPKRSSTTARTSNASNLVDDTRSIAASEQSRDEGDQVAGRPASRLSSREQESPSASFIRRSIDSNSVRSAGVSSQNSSQDEGGKPITSVSHENIAAPSQESPILPPEEGMEEPEPFREFAVGNTSVRSDETRLATPELSDGASTSRKSPLSTPSSLRTASVSQPAILQSPTKFETHVPGVVPGEPALKGENEPFALNGQIHKPVQMVQSTPNIVPAQTPDDLQNATVDVTTRDTQEGSNPGPVVMLHQQATCPELASTIQQAALPLNNILCNSDAVEMKQSKRKAVTESLGAEINSISDVPCPLATDFPTTEVRRPENNEAAQVLVHHLEHNSKQDVSTSDIASQSRVELHFRDATGDNLGAGSGAEVKPVGDHVTKGVSADDAPGAVLFTNPEQIPSTEPVRRPSRTRSMSESIVQATEALAELVDQEQEDGTQVSSAETDPGTANKGSDDVATITAAATVGSKLATEAQGNEPSLPVVHDVSTANTAEISVAQGQLPETVAQGQPAAKPHAAGNTCAVPLSNVAAPESSETIKEQTQGDALIKLSSDKADMARAVQDAATATATAAMPAAALEQRSNENERVAVVGAGNETVEVAQVQTVGRELDCGNMPGCDLASEESAMASVTTEVPVRSHVSETSLTAGPKVVDAIKETAPDVNMHSERGVAVAEKSCSAPEPDVKEPKGSAAPLQDGVTGTESHPEDVVGQKEHIVLSEVVGWGLSKKEQAHKMLSDSVPELRGLEPDVTAAVARASADSVADVVAGPEGSVRSAVAAEHGTEQRSEKTSAAVPAAITAADAESEETKEKENITEQAAARTADVVTLATHLAEETTERVNTPPVLTPPGSADAKTGSTSTEKGIADELADRTALPPPVVPEAKTEVGAGATEAVGAAAADVEVKVQANDFLQEAVCIGVVSEPLVHEPAEELKVQVKDDKQVVEVAEVVAVELVAKPEGCEALDKEVGANTESCLDHAVSPAISAEPSTSQASGISIASAEAENNTHVAASVTPKPSAVLPAAEAPQPPSAEPEVEGKPQLAAVPDPALLSRLLAQEADESDVDEGATARSTLSATSIPPTPRNSVDSVRLSTGLDDEEASFAIPATPESVRPKSRDSDSSGVSFRRVGLQPAFTTAGLLGLRDLQHRHGQHQAHNVSSLSVNTLVRGGGSTGSLVSGRVFGDVLQAVVKRETLVATSVTSSDKGSELDLEEAKEIEGKRAVAEKQKTAREGQVDEDGEDEMTADEGMLPKMALVIAGAMAIGKFFAKP